MPFLICSLFKDRVFACFIWCWLIYIQQNHLLNFYSLNAYLNFLFHSSKALRQNKFSSPHYTKSSSFQCSYYIPYSKGIIENYIKNQPTGVVIFLWQSSLDLMRTLKSALRLHRWHSWRSILAMHPGMVFISNQDVWNIPMRSFDFVIRGCLFSLLWRGSNSEICLCRISSW